MLIDSHTHLYSEEFDQDIDLVIQRANEAGIEKFYLPAIDSTYTERMLDLERKHPGQMFPMMGLHPTSVKPESYESELEQVRAWLNKRPFAAVGEIGIDLYWDKSTLGIQREAFKKQIGWAKEKSLPIVIHCRESFDEIFEVLEEEIETSPLGSQDKLVGIFHCFTGTKKQAERAVGFNMKLGIGGVVTFKNGKIDQFLKEIPLENIVLETDSPYLSPVPFRGKRNESSYLKYIVSKLSDIYGVSENEIAQITSRNANSIFAI